MPNGGFDEQLMGMSGERRLRSNFSETGRKNSPQLLYSKHIQVTVIVINLRGAR